MKNVYYFFTLTALVFAFPAIAQPDSITVLEEVFLVDTRLKDFSTGQTVIKISDSATKHTRPLLTSLLNFNTPIFFKENGNGMVSSLSF
ncbi:hypothetical protein LZ575_04870 [Antarcticibacterium sp. 1MA-6-2]|uniref:hypothetical protein n=1 Tax=Antarcticibacterium sp. 1MA-6-2 TaxID=2908210 RepID=UPI001F439378|nr:hypothetical protein [Antarcticibacterium sp. 1MA-6-2]UJH91971.1 hypothetical protein LZ575_04870 [Antarcticibacterium sp. 1MA-6-2]